GKNLTGLRVGVWWVWWGGFSHYPETVIDHKQPAKKANDSSKRVTETTPQNPQNPSPLFQSPCFRTLAVPPREQPHAVDDLALALRQPDAKPTVVDAATGTSDVEQRGLKLGARSPNDPAVARPLFSPTRRTLDHLRRGVAPVKAEVLLPLHQHPRQC